MENLLNIIKDKTDQKKIQKKPLHINSTSKILNPGEKAKLIISVIRANLPRTHTVGYSANPHITLMPCMPNAP